MGGNVTVRFGTADSFGADKRLVPTTIQAAGKNQIEQWFRPNSVEVQAQSTGTSPN